MCGARAACACKRGKNTYAVDSMSSRKIRLCLCALLLALSACGGRTASFEDESFGGYPQTGGAGGRHNNGGSAGSAAAPVGGSAGTQPMGGGTGGVSGAGALSGSAGFGAISGSAGATGGSAGVGGFGGSVGGVGGSAGFGANGGVSGSAGSGGTIVEACVNLVATECAPCLCQTCAPSLLSCFSDLGCAVIFTCLAQTNCTGLECLAPNTCGKVIDEYGGPFGGSARKVFQLAACSVTSQNTCGCN